MKRTSPFFTTIFCLTILTATTLAQSRLANALVLVNSTSTAYYQDFAHLIQPYLAHFGVPHTVLDIATTPVPANIGDYALVIIGHRQIDAGNACAGGPCLDSSEQSMLASAINAGTGFVNFDNDLSADGATGRYQFVRDIFNFGYNTSTNGSDVTFATPATHYIIQNHAGAETIATTSMKLAGITLPGNVTSLASSGSQAFLAVTSCGTGRAVQFGSYDWISHSVQGPLLGLDDLFWRSLVWAARKPFAMQALPPFVTMRIDDETGPFAWINTANEFGFKPWVGVFLHSVSDTDAATLSSLVNAGKATAAIHAFNDPGFFYFNRSGGANFPDATIAAYFAEATQWLTTHNIPVSKVVLPHGYEFGNNVFQELKDWGVEFIGTRVTPGVPFVGSAWLMNGPFRLYETGVNSEVRPVYYADYITIPGHPEFAGQFFNCISEVWEDAGYDTWVPNNDVARSVGRGTRQTLRALDSMSLATLFTHGFYIDSAITPDNWRAILQGITNNIARAHPIHVTLDYACQYLRAIHNSEITSSVYQPASRQITIHFGGQTDMATKCYVFTEQGGSILPIMVDVPTFSGAAEGDFTLPGPLDRIVVMPSSASLATGGTLQFTAQGYDASNNLIPNLPFAWNVVNGGGAISDSGLFTASSTPGQYDSTIRASFGSINGYASVQVVAPSLHHFTFEPITSPKYAGIPFGVTIKARDVSANLLTSYSGQAALSDTTGTILPSQTGNFVGGQWTGDVTIGSEAHGVSITAGAGGATGASVAFEVQGEAGFYQVTSSLYQHPTNVPFQITVTRYPGATVQSWDDAHQDPVLPTITNGGLLNDHDGNWDEFWNATYRPTPAIFVGHNEFENNGLQPIHFFSAGIPNGSYQVRASLYTYIHTRYYYGFTRNEAMARTRSVDNVKGEQNGSGGLEFAEYSLGTVSITNGRFDLWASDGDVINDTAYFFGWGAISLTPVNANPDATIQSWDDSHQDPVLPTITNGGLLNDHDGNWDEFWSQGYRPTPAIYAGHNEFENNGLQPMHFFSDGIPNGSYEVRANLYTYIHTRYYYGFTRNEAMAKTRSVDNVKGEQNGTGGLEFAEYSLGTLSITNGRFDLWASDGDVINDTAYLFGWGAIRLVAASGFSIALTSSSQTMLFDANGNGTYGEPGDNVRTLVNGTLNILARDTTPGTGIRITASDSLGRTGYNTYTFTLNPCITTHPSNQAVTVGQTASFSAAASGTPVPTVQWQVSTDNALTWSDVSGATAPTLTFVAQAADQGKRYHAVFTNVAGAATSDAATLTVYARPTAVVSGTTAICRGSAATVTAALTGQGPWNVTYFDGTTTTPHTGVGGTGTSGTDSLNVSPTSTRTYTVTALSDAHGAAQAGDLTGSAVVTVNVPPGAPSPNASYSVAPTLSLKIDIAALLGTWQGSGLGVQSAGPGSSAGGTVSRDSRRIYYTPPSGTLSEDHIPYTVSDGNGCTTAATIDVFFVSTPGAAKGITLSGGMVTVMFAGIPGYGYEVQRCPDPSFASYTTVLATNAPAAGVFMFSESPPGNSAYYRLTSH